jgi:hypothetical protein
MHRFASSVPLLSQLKAVFEPGSSLGSSTENTLANVHFADLSVLHISISSSNAARSEGASA